MRNYGFFLCMVIVVSLCFFGCDVVAFAQQSSEAGGYLAAYQEPVAKPVQTSWWSTFSYLLSLLVVFAFVAFLAYIVSRALGNKFGVTNAGKSGKVLDSLPLGTNRSLYVVEIAGKVMLLGVAEQNITLLDEITDELEIARLRENADQNFKNEDFQQIFEKQIISLNQLSKRIPTLLKEKKDRREEKR